MGANEGPSGGKMNSYRFGTMRHSGQNNSLDMITFSMSTFRIPNDIGDGRTAQD